ncbi:hypothetical protein B0T10DRAFT_590516 [Thelonectria olida]|uniref:Dienelactone hydrolase domain-containing protein n=1 Tax=Thelonectria olida TaxID=1576542 RepID=A0A9P9AHS0_9HYPO|nr:hypothetical protein B0T10DRAFT_590516 [Thelonectria olida]
MASKACCELAPVSAEYVNTGRWEMVAGVNTYIVGNEKAEKAIIDIYDVFGVVSQTIQGADRLAASTSALVFLPDLFDGKPLDKSLVPTDTEEKQRQVMAFVAGPANIATNLEKVLKIREEIGRRWLAVEDHIGIFGLCWGGKVAILACGNDNENKGRRFNVSGTAHPGQLTIRKRRLEVKDAEATNVPHILLASPGEPEDVVAQYKEVETYSTMFHGWMGARANLEDPANLKEYERGYKQTAEFFSKYL